MPSKGRGGIATPDPIINDGDDDEIESVPISPSAFGPAYAPPNDSPNGSAVGDFESIVRAMAIQVSQVNDRIVALEEQNAQLAVRLVATESRLTPVTPAGISPAVLEQAEVQTLTAAAGAGLIAPPSPRTSGVDAGSDPHRMVAFIPKEDLLNPKFVVFETFCNGQRIRIKRGSVGMLPFGHAVDLARSGHGHVVDIAALKSIDVEIAQMADPLARPLADPNGNVVPPEEYARAFAE